MHITQWISENIFAFDALLIAFILIVILLVYAIKTNRKLSKKTLELEETLDELQEQKLALDQHSIVSITDIKGTIIYVNEKFIHISGYSKEELIGQNHRLLNSGQHNSLFWKNMYQTLISGKVWKNRNICNVKKDGTPYWVDTIIMPFSKNGRPDHYLAIRTDVTEYQEIQLELEQLYDESQAIMKEKESLLKEIEILAYNDALTDIPNRLSIMNSFEKTLALAKRNSLMLSVMFIDLDGFKLINDTLDHETGDRVLKEVANILKTSLREDDLYGRLGGDEFVVIAVGMKNEADTASLCEKLLQKINKIELPEEVQKSFGASIGVINTQPTREITTQTLLKEADKLMYEVKKRDKNNFIIQSL